MWRTVCRIELINIKKLRHGSLILGLPYAFTTFRPLTPSRPQTMYFQNSVCRSYSTIASWSKGFLSLEAVRRAVQNFKHIDLEKYKVRLLKYTTFKALLGQLLIRMIFAYFAWEHMWRQYHMPLNEPLRVKTKGTFTRKLCERLFKISNILSCYL